MARTKRPAKTKKPAISELPPLMEEEEDGDMLSNGYPGEDEDEDEDEDISNMSEDFFSRTPRSFASDAVGAMPSQDFAYGGFNGGMAGPPVGQHTTPPMWKDAHRSPKTVQLRVCHVREGIDFHVGNIYAKASVSELVRKFRKDGIYNLTPVDMTGNATGATFPIAVAEDHEALKEPATGGNGAQQVLHGAPMGVASLDPAILAFFSQQVDTARSEVERERRAIRQERQTLQDEWSRVSKERMSLAVTNADSAVNLHSKLIDKDQDRAKSSQDQLMVFMQAQQAVAAQRAEAIMAQQKHQSDLVQAQMENNIKSQGMRLEAERQRMEQERKREREEQKRNDADRQQAWEREQERMREHNRMMLGLMEKQHSAQDPFGSLTGMAEKAEPLIELAKKYMPMLAMGGGSSGGITETIASTIGQVVQGQVEVAKAQAQAAGQAMAMQQQIAMLEAEEAQYEQDGPQMLQDPNAPMPAAEAFAPRFSPQGEARPLGHAPPTFEMPPAAPRPDPTANLDPNVAKAARRACRILVQKLRSAPQGNWSDLVVSAISAEPSMIPYLEAVGIRGGIMENGGDLQLADMVVAQVDESGLLPPTFPR